jgi:ATP-dependent DNA helicase RecG
MTIEGAERFGLAQLHQLRGRIGRGPHPGFCCLFANPQTEEAEQRLAALVESGDGFRLAELDFTLRGPGDLLGTRQHGMPPLRIADLARDAAVVEEAQRDARALVESDPGLAQPDHAPLRRMALIRYGKSLDLGDVG